MMQNYLYTFDILKAYMSNYIAIIVFLVTIYNYNLQPTRLLVPQSYLKLLSFWLVLFLFWTFFCLISLSESYLISRYISHITILRESFSVLLSRICSFSWVIIWEHDFVEILYNLGLDRFCLNPELIHKLLGYFEFFSAYYV